MPSYAQLLRHPKWQKKRLEIMQRDNFSCRFCFDTESTLNVHHDNYWPGHLPWEYPDNIFYTLCEACHVLCDNKDCPRHEFKEILVSRYCYGTLTMEAVDYLFARHQLAAL